MWDDVKLWKNIFELLQACLALLDPNSHITKLGIKFSYSQLSIELQNDFLWIMNEQNRNFKSQILRLIYGR